MKEHIPSSFSMSAVLSFKCIENMHAEHKCKYCIKTFFESLRKQVMKKIN